MGIPLPTQTVRSHRLLDSVWIIPTVMLSIIGAMTAWFAYDDYERTLEQEYRFLEAHARIADTQLSGLLRNIKQMLRQIAEEVPTLPPEQFAAYERILAERKREAPEIRVLAVTNADGRIILTINPLLRNFDASQREYFTAHRDGKGQAFHITRPFKTSFDDYAIASSVAIYDAQHRFRGVVTSGINYKYFESVMKQIRPEGADSVATVFNRAGDIIYRQPDPGKYVGQSVAASPLFQNYIRSGQPATRSIGVTSFDGIKRIYVHHAIGNTTLSLAVARPYDAVFAEWYRSLAMRLLIFTLAAAVTLYLAGIARRRQRETLSSKAFSEQLIATANVMLVGLDAAGKVTIFNEAAEHISGYRRDEVLGRDWFALAVPRERYPQVWEMFRTMQETGIVLPTFENPILTKDQRERIISWQNSVIYDHGAIAGTISFGIDITEHAQMEKIRRSEEVSRRLVSLQEEERRRLAVELHDRASPNLSAVDINLGLLSDSLPARTAKRLSDLLEDTSALLRDTVASIRSISTDFRPPVLDHAGFWPAVEGYARQFSRRTGLAVHVDNRECDMRLPTDTETNLFRIVQEALNNCARHAQAQTIHIRCARSGEAATLSIADDGIGFDPDEQQGQGLATMQKRAEFIGGKLIFDTAPGKGARIAVEFKAFEAALS